MATTNYQTGTVVTKEWLNDVDANVYGVKSYGAVGDGTTDDTAAIQAAIDAAETAGGGLVFLPRGNYKISQPLAISNKGVRIVGESMYSTTIIKTGSDCTSVNFDNAACDLCSIEQLRFVGDGTTQTGGGVISFTVAGALGVVIDRVLMEDVYSNVICDLPPLSINDVIITRCEFLRTKKYGIYMKGALNWMIQNNIVSMTDGAANTVALFIDANSEGNLFSNTYFLGGEYVLRSINNNKENKFLQVIFDGGSVSSACIYDSASIRNHFINCWASTQGSGGRAIVIDNAAVVGFRWIEGEIIGIQQHGILVTAAGDFHIEGGRICNWGIQTAGTYSGISIAAGASMRFTVKNVIFAQDSDISGNAWNGVNINSGSYGHYEVTGCSGIGLTGTVIADSGTCSTARVENNPGYNPIGIQVVVAGASPYTYTAGHAPEMVCVTGGTVSIIAVGGSAIYSSTDQTVVLAPNQSMVITHSVAPNLTISRN